MSFETAGGGQYDQYQNQGADINAFEKKEFQDMDDIFSNPQDEPIAKLIELDEDEVCGMRLKNTF